MNGGNQETKSEIRARLEELASFQQLLGPAEDGPPVASFSAATKLGFVRAKVTERKAELEKLLESAEEDLSASIIDSHKAICLVKKMDEKAAYGNDPAMYYTLGICGEAGEMANAIVKAQRNGADREKVLAAVRSELPDVIVYSYVLAYVLDINLNQLVNEKVGIVIERARSGYYGGVLPAGTPGAL